MARRTLTPTRPRGPIRDLEDDARQIGANLGTDDVDVEAHDDLDDPDAPKGSVSWTTAHFERMYQPRNYDPRVGARRDPDTIWYPSLIHDQQIEHKAKMRTARNERIWYRETELPRGARVFDVTDGATLQCPVDICGQITGNGPKRVHSWTTLRDHMQAKHSNEWTSWKKLIDDKVDEETNASLDRIEIKGMSRNAAPKGGAPDPE